MTGKRTIIVALLLGLSLVLSGCKKKKPPLPAPQAQAPTITDTNVPSEIPEVPVPQPTPTPAPTAPAPPVAKKTKPRTPKSEAKKSTQPPASGDKVIVEEGGKQPDPSQPPLVAETNPQAAQQRADANQLLSAAEYNINNLHRNLTADDQAIIQHIRGFIDQSRQALKDGDTERAYTLATKARLMSDQLVKR